MCDLCDANNATKSHPPEYAVDGMETWWQSPPLSRGMKYNEVNLTIDLGQVSSLSYTTEYNLTYLLIGSILLEGELNIKQL